MLKHGLYAPKATTGEDDGLQTAIAWCGRIHGRRGYDGSGLGGVSWRLPQCREQG
jgi:hypothetical protein